MPHGVGESLVVEGTAFSRLRAIRCPGYLVEEGDAVAAAEFARGRRLARDY